MLLRDILLVLLSLSLRTYADKYYTKKDKLKLREHVREMFYHAYDNYLLYASDYDELRPLTCDGTDTWGSYSLTLIDALDTLAIMGNYSEFRRVVNLLENKLNFDRDINVSVFETNIRVVGGLLSAHLFSKRAGVSVEKGWPCQGPLLRLAEDLAKRLLPAFDSATGMPYGTVNLRYGVPKGETPITCTAGVGTFLVEFGALSRLTGNPIFEEVALNAVYALWERRSAIGLFGNHIDVETARWTAMDAGIGAGVDSFFEYLVKAATLLNRPHLMSMFNEAREKIDMYMKREDWYVWVNMNKGHPTLPVFQSLEAFWPGVLSMIGDTSAAMRSIVKYSTIWEKYGFLPEFFNIATMQLTAKRESYPLRPELVESLWYLYRSTENQYLLEIGERMLNSINFSARTKCGYATIRNVLTHEKENRMESFFLAETTKYLYLLFDEENFMHKSAEGEIIETAFGSCLANAGGYIFNTEAHPIDMSALYCCHDLKEDIFTDLDFNEFSNEALLKAQHEQNVEEAEKYMRMYECNNTPTDDDKIHRTVNTKANKETTELSVDIEVYDENNEPMGEALVHSFEKITQSARHTSNLDNATKITTEQQKKRSLTVEDLRKFFTLERQYFTRTVEVLEFIKSFMGNFTINQSSVQKRFKSLLDAQERRPFSLWELYVLHQRAQVNKLLAEQFILMDDNEQNVKILKSILLVLNNVNNINQHNELTSEIAHKVLTASTYFERQLANTTAMQEFVANIVVTDKEENFQYKYILAANEIESLPLPTHNYTLNEIFANFQRATELKLHMIETFERLQELIVDKSGSNATINQVNAPKDKEQMKNAIGNLINITDQTNLTKDVEKKATTNASVWQQLIQKILSTTISQGNKLNEKELLEKVRYSMERYLNQNYAVDDYEIFYCSQQTFLERFSYRNFYPPAA